MQLMRKTPDIPHAIASQRRRLVYQFIFMIQKEKSFRLKILNSVDVFFLFKSQILNGFSQNHKVFLHVIELEWN